MNDLLRQCVKEGYKKIYVMSCNPGHHEIDKDLKEMKGIMITYAKNTLITDSTIYDQDYLPLIEAENSLIKLATENGIDYDNDEYLYEMYSELEGYINEGTLEDIWDKILEIGKKIIGFFLFIFKKIIDFAKSVIDKIKAIFKEKDRNIPCKIKSSYIDPDSKEVKEFVANDIGEIHDKFMKSAESFSKKIDEFTKEQNETIKRMHENNERLARKNKSSVHESMNIINTVSVVVMSKNKNNIVLLDDIKNGLTIPSGSVQMDEDKRDAVIRVLKDTIDIVPTVFEEYTTNSFVKNYPEGSGDENETEFIDTCFIVSDYTGKVYNNHPERCTQVGYISLEKIADLYIKFPGKLSWFLRDYLDASGKEEYEKAITKDKETTYSTTPGIKYTGYISDVRKASKILNDTSLSYIWTQLGKKEQLPTIVVTVSAEGGGGHVYVDSVSSNIYGDRSIINIMLPRFKKFCDDTDSTNYDKDYEYHSLHALFVGVLLYINNKANYDLLFATASYLATKYTGGAYITEDVKIVDYIVEHYGLKRINRIIEENDIKHWFELAKEAGIKSNINTDFYIKEDVTGFEAPEIPNAAKSLTRRLKYAIRKPRYKINAMKRDIDNKLGGPIEKDPGVTPVNPEVPEENNEETPVVSESVLYTLESSSYIKTDDFVMILEDSKNDTYLKKIFYNDRIRQNKQVLDMYKKVKEENQFIKYSFLETKKYLGKNLFVDLSYYNEIFFKNNLMKLDRGVNLYIDLMERLLNGDRFSSYTKKTVFIPIEDWDKNPGTRMWLYKDDINPISVILRMLQMNPGKLKEVFGNMDVLFTSNSGKYFKINFSTQKDLKTLAVKFKLFITRLHDGQPVSTEDTDDTPNTVESKKAIVTNIVDKLEKSQGITLVAKAATGVTTKVTAEELKKKAEEGINTEEIKEKKKEELLDAINKAADNSTTTDGAIDDLEEDRIKQLIMDLAADEEEKVKINNARASRMLQLQNDMLDREIKGMKIRDILNQEAIDAVKPLDETTIPVSGINKEQWSHLKYINFDKDYNINEDIVKMLDKLSKLNHPIVVRGIEVTDNSTSEDFVDLYTIDFEDYRGKRFKIRVDIPKFKNNNYLVLRGNKKTIQTQLFNMPIIKTDDNTCQIISNYNKIFISRFGSVAGKSLPYADRLIKVLNKYQGKDIKVTFGDCSRISTKYDLPIDYIDIGSVIKMIENSKYIFYFNQDELRKVGYELDYNKGLPYGYSKIDKEVLYYRGSDYVGNGKASFPISGVISTYLSASSADFASAFDSVKNSTKYMYSKCSILSTNIPLIVICGYNEGLVSTLKKANIEYTIKEKLEKGDRQISYDHIKFKDGYIVYTVDYNSSLLMNGLKECLTEEYSLKDLNSKSMFVDFLDNFGGRIKSDGLDNFYDLLIDPITEEILDYYKLPVGYVEVLLHANLLLADNKYIKHTDSSSRRARRQELIAVKFYRALSESYASYANQVRHNMKGAQFTMKQSAVIDRFLEDSISSDASIINAINDVETKNAVTYKGDSGMNTDRAYSLDKRTYDKSMLNILGMSTGFAGNVGITRQATIDMSIDTKRGYLKPIDNNLEKMSSAKSLTITEALNPMGTTRDDPFRTAMAFIQTAKHAVRTDVGDPLLVTNGSDEALPYITSDIFAFKAKYGGKIVEITESTIILEYNNGIKDSINIAETIEKNSDGGFFVPMKLDIADGFKVGSKFKEGEIIAYDKLSFSNKIGESGNIAYNVGTLAKVAIINTDEGFEDSAIVTETMAERMATNIIVQKDVVLPKETNIYNLITSGTAVEEGDTLITIQNPYSEDDVNVLLKNLAGDEDMISELGRRSIKSSVTGIVKGIKIYRTVEIEDLSESLQKVVKAYEAPIKKQKKYLESQGIGTSDLPATYALPATGKLKNCVDGVKIEFYLEFHDVLAIGDKIVFDRANKGIIKDIIPKDKAPYTAFRPNEEISAFANVSSFNKRMVTSPMTMGALNKLMIELERSIKDILAVPYDDSKI